MSTFTISVDKKPIAADLQSLFSQTTWAKKRNPEDIEALIKSLGIFTAVWSDGKLIGFGRVLSDGVYRALIEDVVVDEAWRGRGVGKAVVASLMDQLTDIEEVFLHTRDHLIPFYEDAGFDMYDGITMKRPGSD